MPYVLSMKLMQPIGAELEAGGDLLIFKREDFLMVAPIRPPECWMFSCDFPFPVFVSFPAFFLCAPVFVLCLTLVQRLRRSLFSGPVFPLASLCLLSSALWFYAALPLYPCVLSWFLLFCFCISLSSVSSVLLNTIYTFKTKWLQDNLAVSSVSCTCRYLSLWSWSDAFLYRLQHLQKSEYLYYVV